MRRGFFPIVVSLVFCFALAIPSRAQAQAQPASTKQVEARPEQTTEKSPTEREMAEMRADLFMIRKQFSEAAAAYLTLLEQEPKNAVLLNKTGIAYHQLMKLKEAKRYYDKSVKADRTYAFAYNNLGAVQYDMGNYRAAVKQFQKAVALDPNLAAAYSGLGSAFFARKKYEEALASMLRALQLDPEIFERRSAFGSVVQSRSVEDRGLFYFFLAKSFALRSNVERCAHYLRKARDEGFKSMDTVDSDPAFAAVIKEKLVQDVLHPAEATGAPPQPGD